MTYADDGNKALIKKFDEEGIHIDICLYQGGYSCKERTGSIWKTLCEKHKEVKPTLKEQVVRFVRFWLSQV